MKSGTLAGCYDLSTIRADVDAILDTFLIQKSAVTRDAHISALADTLRIFLGGGKRLRPVLCVIGWHAGGGQGESEPAVTLAASLEMFHAFALIHDDVMDSSDIRRGRPTVHRILAERWPHPPKQDRARRFGTNGAILLGDLALAWSEELLHQAGMTQCQRSAVQPILSAMRTELMLGQYLDLLATGQPDDDVDAALKVIRYKTAKYTVERPLQVGAALAGAGEPVLAACTDFGVPLGEAFQLRDDLLGVFGDPTVTGKSRLDDLREGKRTTLMALALRLANATQAARLTTLVGNPGLEECHAAEIRRILTITEARAGIERMISSEYRRALAALALAPFPPAAIATLSVLADSVVRRTS